MNSQSMTVVGTEWAMVNTPQRLKVRRYLHLTLLMEVGRSRLISFALANVLLRLLQQV
jgi:hypothetical protein